MKMIIDKNKILKVFENIERLDTNKSNASKNLKQRYLKAKCLGYNLKNIKRVFILKK